MDAPAQAWTDEDRARWARIAAHPFERPDAPLDFTRRLAAKLGWPLAHARAAVEDYRRFCFLATTGAIVATPSEEVDEVWHLHLTDTRDYWDVWCAALGRRLHHAPTRGAPGDAQRFREQYARTLAVYETFFGYADPRFWPAANRRFRAQSRYRLIDRDRRLVFWRPHLPAWRRLPGPALAALFTSALASCARGAPLDWDGPTFLEFYAALAFGGLAFGFVLDRLMARAGSGRGAGALSTLEMAYLAGGAKRAAAALFADAAARDRASVTAQRVEISGGPLAGSYASLSAFTRAFRVSDAARQTHAALVRRNLAQDAAGVAWSRLAWIAPLTPAVTLGCAKFWIGLTHGKQVGFLSLSLLATLFALAPALIRDRWLTQVGRSALADLRERHDHALRAPRRQDLALVAALAGAGALAGTPLAAYAEFERGSKSGGDGSGGCGGDGGGGCGGCVGD